MIRSKVLRFLLFRNPQSVGNPKNFLSFHNLQKCQHMSTVNLMKEQRNQNVVSKPKHLSKETNQSVLNEKEEAFLVKIKNDPDTFGDPPETEIIDEGDLQEQEHYENQPTPNQKLRTKQYADMIKALIRKRKIKEAIDVLEVRMLKVDQVKPEDYIYNLLIGACGRVGYTKKAFSLYNKMKQRGLKVMGGTYTALFNACANSPWPEDGLTRARHLREIMIEKMYEPNDTNYNAMIKAFGRCGDLNTAFQVADEMAAKRIKIKDDTINFLLQACVTDKEAGFRHALLVWRRLVDKKIAPSVYTYNLMLRAIRDCGIGDVEVTQDVLSKIVNTHSVKQIESNIQFLPLNAETDKKTDDSSVEVTNSLENVEGKSLMELDDRFTPNLMAKVPHLGSVQSLTEITKPEDRLLLVGGMNGFLLNMEEHGCVPDIKTFTQLLDCLPGNLTSEKRLIKAMKNLRVKPDADFYNMLIKKRSMRFDYENARNVVDEMKLERCWPNIMTYGVLALGCKTKEEAEDLIEEMKKYDYRLNAEILGAMVHQACFHRNFPYILEVMQRCLTEDVKPNKKFMECLQNFHKEYKRISYDTEHKLSKNKSFQKAFKIFSMRYKQWLEEVKVDETEDEHPWTQYRQNVEADVDKYKDKEARFKPRHTSQFRVKTSTKQRY